MSSVDDGKGNRNNLITVEPPRKDSIVPAATELKEKPIETSQPVDEPKLIESSMPIPESKTIEQHITVDQPQSHAQPEPVHKSQPVENSEPAPTQFIDIATMPHALTEAATPAAEPLLRHETQMNVDADADAGTDDEAVPASIEAVEERDAPLLAHEVTFPTSQAQPEEDSWDDEPSHYEEEKSEKTAEVDEDDGVPLMRHETSPRASAVEQFEQSTPLMKHETSPINLATATDDNVAPLLHHETMSQETDLSRPTRRSSRSQDRTEDVVLEKLPTDQAAILQHLRRASVRHSDDEDTDGSSSPSHSSRESRSLARSFSNASHGSAKTLGAINETEEDMESSKPEQFESSNDFASILASAAAERDGKLNQLSSDRFEQQSTSTHYIPKHSHKHMPSQTGPIELLTPPMTPEMRESDFIAEERFQPFPAAASEPTKEFQDVSESRDETVKSEAPKFESMDIEEQSEQSILTALKGLFFGLGTWFVGLFGGPGRAT